MNKLETAIQTYLKHLDSIIETYNNALGVNGQLYSEQEAIRIFTRSQNLINKITEKDSPYAQQVNTLSKETLSMDYKAELIVGIVMGLKDELTVGALNSIPEIVRGELFENFLEMAEYLANEGYKDAAAVIAGSSLEAHLRRLAKKHDIVIEVAGSSTKPLYKKAESINQELYKVKAYSLLDQKQITAWLDLRNNAAHGNYSAYSINQVMRFIEWTIDFIAKNSA